MNDNLMMMFTELLYMVVGDVTLYVVQCVNNKITPYLNFIYIGYLPVTLRMIMWH